MVSLITSTNTTSGKPDLDEIKKASSLGSKWDQFLTQLDKFIQLRVKKDAHSLEPRTTAFFGLLGGTSEASLVKDYSNTDPDDYGIDIKKLTNEAQLQTDQAKTLFQALVRRNYAQRMYEALATQPTQSHGLHNDSDYLVDLIKIDGLEEVLRRGFVKLADIIQDPKIIDALTQSAKQNNDRAAALVLAERMISEHAPNTAWTLDERNRLAEFQKLVELSDIFIKYDPIFYPNKLREIQSEPIMVRGGDDNLTVVQPMALGIRTQSELEGILTRKNAITIFHDMRFITGKSFGRADRELPYPKLSPIVNERLFLNHREKLNKEQLEELAEYAIAVKAIDANGTQRGEVEYITEILQRNNQDSSYSHVIANLEYPKPTASPVEDLKAAFLADGVGLNSFTRRVALGDDIFIQKIKTEPNQRALLISGPEGYTELGGNFAKELERMVRLNYHVEDYVQVIKLLVRFKKEIQNPLEIEENQKIAEEVIAKIGYSRCPDFINSKLFGDQKGETITALQKEFIKANPDDRVEIRLLCERLANLDGVGFAKTIQSYLYQIENLDRGRIQTEKEASRNFDFLHLKDLVTETQHHYPQNAKDQDFELSNEEYKLLIPYELNYLLDRFKRDFRNETLKLNNYIPRLIHVVLAHLNIQKPELDIKELEKQVEPQVKNLLRLTEFDVLTKVKEFEAMIDKLAT